MMFDANAEVYRQEVRSLIEGLSRDVEQAQSVADEAVARAAKLEESLTLLGCKHAKACELLMEAETQHRLDQSLLADWKACATYQRDMADRLQETVRSMSQTPNETPTVTGTNYTSEVALWKSVVAILVDKIHEQDDMLRDVEVVVDEE
jgi:hypothetical protein